MALQLLYQMGYSAESAPDPEKLTQAIEEFVANLEPGAAETESIAYADALTRGAVAYQKEITALITQCLKNWKIERLTRVDAAILKIAVYEMRWGGIPKQVAIDEALEIAKRFSTDEAAKFLNGVLNAVADLPPTESPAL